MATWVTGSGTLRNPEEAVEAYERGSGISADAAENRPNVLLFQHEMAGTYSRLGGIRRDGQARRDGQVLPDRGRGVVEAGEAAARRDRVPGRAG